MASEHPVAPNPVSNGAGAIRNPFLDPDRAANEAEAPARDVAHGHGEVRWPPTRRHARRSRGASGGRVTDAAGSGRLVHVVLLSRPCRPDPEWRLARLPAALRACARACVNTIHGRRAGGRWTTGAALGRALAALVLVTIAIAALNERDSARGARDYALRQVAAANRATARLSAANHVLRRQRERLVAVAREAERQQSSAAAAARRWRSLAARRPGHADRERRRRR